MSGSTLKPLFRKDDAHENKPNQRLPHQNPFHEEELQDLDRRASAAGLDRSKYVRMKLSAAKVKPNPQVDIPALIAVMHEAGARVDNVLYRARFRNGIIDVPVLHRALDEVRQAEEVIRTAFKERGTNVTHD